MASPASFFGGVSNLLDLVVISLVTDLREGTAAMGLPVDLALRGGRVGLVLLDEEGRAAIPAREERVRYGPIFRTEEA